MEAELKDQALQLRSIDRLSLSQIASRLGVAKSTVSLWVREYPLTDEEILLHKRSHQLPLLSVKCVICNKTFNTYKSFAKYCSLRCTGKGDKGRNQRTIKHTKTYRKRHKERAVKYKGGGCFICGYSRCIRALKFHHLDPDQKDFQISQAGISWERIVLELDKCILVCGNCHDEIHDGLISVGTWPNGKALT